MKGKMRNPKQKHEPKMKAKSGKKVKKYGQHVKMQRKTGRYSAQEKRNKSDKMAQKRQKSEKVRPTCENAAYNGPLGNARKTQ